MIIILVLVLIQAGTQTDHPSIRPMPRDQKEAASAGFDSLPPDMLANIHGRLGFPDRLAFAAVFRASRHAFRPEAPCLVLPSESPETATLFSLADRRAVSVRAPAPALRGHAFIGSSGGWLVNPVTGEQRALPAITTIPCLHVRDGGRDFVFPLEHFARGPPCPGGRQPLGTCILEAEKMRTFLYRKVVLSPPTSSSLGVAMLVTGRCFGVAAFATAEDAPWRLAPSRDGVEDAIHHDGRFYSIGYSGAVEAWERDADTGEFSSTAVTPRLADANAGGDPRRRRKYLVASSGPGGRLMVVLKEMTEGWRGRRTWSFKVRVLDGGQWKETHDIGDAALLVGANESLCVSTRVHPGLCAGCVYYTDDDLAQASPCKDDDDHQLGVGLFSLKPGGRVEKVQGLRQRRSWPPPAWLTPTIP